MRNSLLFVFLCSSLLIGNTANGTVIGLNNSSSQKNIIRKKEPETINVTITPGRKDAMFDAKHPVKYFIEVANNYKTVQEGKIGVEVKTDIGGTVGISEMDIKLKGNKTKKIEWDLPMQDPGFYDIVVKINLTDYDDTVRNVFGYKPFEINTPIHKPADFGAFWQKAKDDLSEVNPNYVVKPVDSLSTPTHKVYRVEMNSLDNIKIFGWLTIPRTKGKYPVLYGLGGYRIEMHPLKFDDFAHFTINVRGIGESSHKINPDNQEILTLHLADKNKYVYRGIYMDCLRGLDFIIANENLGLDASRIGLFGGSQGGTLAWILAALSKKVMFCVVDNPTYCDYTENYKICINKPQPEGGFVIKFLKDFLKRHSSISKDKMLNTLSYFEAQNFISDVNCPVLLGLGLLDLTAPPTCTLSVYNKLSADVKKRSEVFAFPNLAHEVPMEHNTFKSTWFYENFATKLLTSKR
ncbi:MAG TPA: acetylxylan esterase [Chitinophagaceae bacterium]|nr:acetylxylan esterase [Chitinophagaceae bacterium]